MPWLLSLVSNLSATAIKAIVVAVIIGAGALYLKHAANKACEVQIETAQVEAREKNLEVIRQLQEKDDAQAAKDMARIEELERKANDLNAKISTGVGLTSDDVARLRGFIQATDNGRARKPRPRPR